MKAAKQFAVGAVNYMAHAVPAREQFHIVRRLAPMFGRLAPALASYKKDGPSDAGLQSLAPIGDALAGMSDEDADYVLFGLLRYAKRQMQNGMGWTDVAAGTSLMFDDISVPQMMQIAWGVLQHNLSDFMAALPSGLLDTKVSAQSVS